MKQIKTNRIRFDIDPAAFDSRFGIIQLEHKDRKYAWKSEILDAFGDPNQGVRSLCYRSGRIYILTDNTATQRIKKEVAGKDSKGVFKSISVLSSEALASEGRKDILAQMLLNALPALGCGPDVQAVNLTGRMQCHHSAWKNKDSRKRPIHVMLDIHVTEEMLLKLDVDTYSAVPAGFKLKDQPLYTLDKSGRMKRSFNQKQKGLFINKRFDDGKSEIPFLCLQDESEFLKSKMGILNRVLSMFKSAYEGVAQISFTYGIDLQDNPELDSAIRRFKKNNKAVIDEWRQRNPYILVKDMVGTDYSADIAEQISGLLNAGTAPSDHSPEIRLIHEADWYSASKEKDPYSTSEGAQHLSLETIAFGGTLSPAVGSILDSCINNLIVKDDLANGRASLWPEGLVLEEDLIFGIIAPANKEGKADSAVMMTIHPDRSFDFKICQADPMSDDETSSLLATVWNENTVGVIRYGNSTIALKNTDMFTIPETDLIQQELRTNASSPIKCKISRSEEARSKFFTAVTDINCFRIDSDSTMAYFNVGIVGSGMNTTIQRGSVVRKFEVITGEDFSGILLTMLTDSHIRNGQMTVIPSPFKYIREFCLASKICE